MKKHFTLLVLATATTATLNSQVALSEDFNNPFALSVNGWTIQNNSSPVGNFTWFQGDPNAFAAFNGNPDDYIAVNYQSTGNNGDISNWLISPTVSIFNGAVVQFATRVAGPTVTYPDRLQLRMSQTSAFTVPTGTASVGSFTTLLLDINPNQTTLTNSAVNNGSVNGYPVAWTVYSVQITGVTGTVTGRFAFRYAVYDTGLNGNNGDYIGIDGFRYMLPCNVSIPSFTICPGNSATLTATGANAGATFTWNTGSNSPSIVVSPGSTTTYTLASTESTGQCPNVTGTVTIGAQLSMNLSASSNTTCVGSAVTLTASSAATSYSWNTGDQTAVITVTPNGTTTYSVLGWTGTFPPSCAGGNTITIYTNPLPTVSILSPGNLLCTTGPSASVTFTGSGASSYAWSSGTFSTTAPTLTVTVPANSPTSTINFTFMVIGTNTNGCKAGTTSTLVISMSPTVNISSSAATVCTNGTVGIAATGADSYQWSGGSTSTNASIVYTAGATAGVVSFTATGTNTAGCSDTEVRTVTVSVCGSTVTGLPDSGFAETAVYPNPFSNEINITGLDGKVVVYNALGQVILNKAIISSYVINTAEFPKGAYIVQAINSAGELVKTVRLVKN